eukprot:7380068-Prymnesium_polylepis.1
MRLAANDRAPGAQSVTRQICARDKLHRGDSAALFVGSGVPSDQCSSVGLRALIGDLRLGAWRLRSRFGPFGLCPLTLSLSVSRTESSAIRGVDPRLSIPATAAHHKWGGRVIRWKYP